LFFCFIFVKVLLNWIGKNHLEVVRGRAWGGLVGGEV